MKINGKFVPPQFLGDRPFSSQIKASAIQYATFSALGGTSKQLVSHHMGDSRPVWASPPQGVGAVSAYSQSQQTMLDELNFFGDISQMTALFLQICQNAYADPASIQKYSELYTQVASDIAQLNKDGDTGFISSMQPILTDFNQLPQQITGANPPFNTFISFVADWTGNFIGQPPPPPSANLLFSQSSTLLADLQNVGLGTLSFSDQANVMMSLFSTMTAMSADAKADLAKFDANFWGSAPAKNSGIFQTWGQLMPQFIASYYWIKDMPNTALFQSDLSNFVKNMQSMAGYNAGSWPNFQAASTAMQNAYNQYFSGSVSWPLAWGVPAQTWISIVFSEMFGAWTHSNSKS